MIHYLITEDDADPPRIGALVVSRSQSPKNVHNIRGLIQRYGCPPILPDYSFHNIDIPYEGLVPVIPLPLDAPLSDMDSVSDHWPNGLSPDLFSFVLILRPKMDEAAVPPNPQPSDEGPKIEMNKNNNWGTIDIYSPLTSPSQFRDLKAKDFDIVDGRPDEVPGLPIGLFNPVFDSFQLRISSNSLASASQLAQAYQLITPFSSTYGQEIGRTGQFKALKSRLMDLLDRFLPNWGYCMIIEANNEISASGSDPYTQAALTYSQYWTDAKFNQIRSQCCCPSMIIAIAGPWMCVLGGIIPNQPVIQPLTPFFFVGNTPSSPICVNFVAKVLASLAESLSEFGKLYQALDRTAVKRNIDRHSPYMRHFTHAGQRVAIRYGGIVAPGKPVFRAQALPEQGKPYRIIVKYGKSYNAAAHRLLEKQQLVPKLLFVSSDGPYEFKVAHRIMVVMEELPYQDLSQTDSFPDCLQNDVSRALSILHKSNMAFADLRAPNIMVVVDEHGEETGAMLVDLDWCGTVGQATYPSDINMEIEWPNGVGPGLPIQLAHDLEMLEKLSDMY